MQHSNRSDATSSQHLALSHEVIMKADAPKFIASYFHIPKIGPGVHVGLKDTGGPAIFSI